MAPDGPDGWRLAVLDMPSAGRCRSGDNRGIANMTDAKPETTEAKQGAGRWQPGQSGNPSGRPKGARHAALMALDAIGEGSAGEVIALDGRACLLHPALTPPGQGAGLAFRWRRMLETGEVSTVGEIATREQINKSYVSRVLRLTLLAPDIVEAILDGRQAPEMTLRGLLKGVPVEWEINGATHSS